MKRRDPTVYARDGWVCQMPVCFNPVSRVIDPGVLHPDPWSASIDHILPLSRGGVNRMYNKRAAHLRCNIKGFQEFAALPAVPRERVLVEPEDAPSYPVGPFYTEWDDLSRQEAFDVLTGTAAGGLTDEQATRAIRCAAAGGMAMPSTYVEVVYVPEVKKYFIRELLTG